MLFAEVIIPLAVPNTYTYSVPEEVEGAVQRGVRVEVQFGRNRLYAGLVLRVSHEPPMYKTKPLVSVLDAHPIVNETQLRFWEWLAVYYCCYLGEVMNVALPSGLRLGSETRLLLSKAFAEDYSSLTDDEYLVAEALAVQGELSIEDVRNILDKTSIHGLIQALLQKEVIELKEELQAKYQPRSVGYVRFAEPYRSTPDTLHTVLDRVAKTERQTQAVLALIDLTRNNEEVEQKELCEKAGIDRPVLHALVKKGFIELYAREVSRTALYRDALIDASPVSEEQNRALDEIAEHFRTRNAVLLHGITGSGKTRVYTELIAETIARGEQVLYLLPEIGLTGQLIERLQRVFGNSIAVYHSRLSLNERVDLWKDTLAGKPIILSARSGLFLPFKKLGLIVIDEEHDPSFKQQDPAPRYNARDAAVYLANLHGAKVLLGTATPSLESYYNTQSGKYGLVTMLRRFGTSELPDIEVIDLKAARKQKRMKGAFSEQLLDEMAAVIAAKEQIILFQNRRGYSPALQCTTCGYTADCANCDVSLTYHLNTNDLRCHYCGYTAKPPTVCPACGSATLSAKGIGTEKVEEELQIYLPEARIARMDFDTVRTKTAHAKLLQAFDAGEIDVLVGTQMVTKGLDFERVRLVGIISADDLLHFPDFRATERAFQLLTQVAGRAGRRGERGRVYIQAYDTTHPVLAEVINNTFETHFTRETVERHKFAYPPFYRLLQVQLKHPDKAVVDMAAEWLAQSLRANSPELVLGPTEPGIARVKSYFLMNILIKLDRTSTRVAATKQLLLQCLQALAQMKGFTTVKVAVDVDPL